MFVYIDQFSKITISCCITLLFKLFFYVTIFYDKKEKIMIRMVSKKDQIYYDLAKIKNSLLGLRGNISSTDDHSEERKTCTNIINVISNIQKKIHDCLFKMKKLDDADRQLLLHDLSYCINAIKYMKKYDIFTGLRECQTEIEKIFKLIKDYSINSDLIDVRQYSITSAVMPDTVDSRDNTPSSSTGYFKIAYNVCADFIRDVCLKIVEFVNFMLRKLSLNRYGMPVRENDDTASVSSDTLQSGINAVKHNKSSAISVQDQQLTIK